MYWPFTFNGTDHDSSQQGNQLKRNINIKLSGPILFTMYVDISLPLHGGNSPFFAKIQGSSFHYFCKKKKKTVAMSSLIFYLFMHDQGYRNRYNHIDKPSGSCNLCEINKYLWFLHIWKIFYQVTKPFQKFEGCDRMVAAVWSGTFFQNA